VATLTTNQRRATALASTRVRPPDQNHFLSIFCRAPPPKPLRRQAKKEGKEMVLSVGFASVTPKRLIKEVYRLRGTTSPFFRSLTNLALPTERS